jgi:hypothetical protein
MRLLIPGPFEPTLKFRYTVFTSKLPFALFYARSAEQPTVNNSPIEVAHGNGSFYVKGKTKWDSINLQCYQFENMTVMEFWMYFQQHQFVPLAIDRRNASYKHDLRLTLLNPNELPMGTWTLHGAFYDTVSFGDMDRGADTEIAQIDVSIRYDYATYKPLI